MQKIGESTTSKEPFVLDRSLFGRLSIIRLPLILLVIFHHNETGGDFIGKMGPRSFLSEVIEWIAHGLAGIRMPVFFVIAGYVLFLNVRPAKDWFLKKIKSRARSVLLPLILWTSLTIVLFAIVQNIPALAHLFSGKSIWSRSVLEMTPLQFWGAYFGRDTELYLYPLWFLRDLFILVLASPAIYWLIRVSRGWLTLALFAVWFVDLDKSLVRDSWLFFTVGAQLAIFNRSIFIADKWGLVSLVAWVSLQALHVQEWIPYAAPVKTLLGIVGVLYASGVILKISPVSSRLQQWSKYSFFFFVAHEPLLTLLRKFYFRVAQPASPGDLFAAYFLIVAMVVATLVIVFKLAERLVPRALDVMTGGRT